MKAGQPVVCRRCDAAAQTPPAPESAPADAPQTDGTTKDLMTGSGTFWCRLHSLGGYGDVCPDCLDAKPLNLIGRYDKPMDLIADYPFRAAA